MENIISYQEGSETIRQMPQNYLIATWLQAAHMWVMDPDPAADNDLCVRVMLAIKNDNVRFKKDGLAILAKVTPNKEFKKLNHTNIDFLSILINNVYPQKDNVFAKKSIRGRWHFGYKNYNPLKNGPGKTFILDQKMVDHLKSRYEY